MKHSFLAICCFLFAGCANVYSTRMIVKHDDATLILDMPKEVETTNLKITYDPEQGAFEITADSWISRNSDTIDSQAKREKEVLEGSSILIEKAAEGAVKGAIKGIVPIP